MQVIKIDPDSIAVNMTHVNLNQRICASFSPWIHPDQERIDENLESLCIGRGRNRHSLGGALNAYSAAYSGCSNSCNAH